jgi:hypothetical protein
LVAEWFDGEYYPPEQIRALYSVQDYPPESFMVIGSEGAMLVPYSSGPILLPEAKFKDVEKPRFEARNHYHHFVDACLGRTKTESHFTQTGPMTEAILLGTIAVRLPGEELVWQPEGLRIPNHRGAERLLQREYRAGWEV